MGFVRTFLDLTGKYKNWVLALHALERGCRCSKLVNGGVLSVGSRSSTISAAWLWGIWTTRPMVWVGLPCSCQSAVAAGCPPCCMSVLFVCLHLQIR